MRKKESIGKYRIYNMMHKENKKERSIVEELKNSPFVPNVSLGPFYFGLSVTQVLNRISPRIKYDYRKRNGEECFNNYSFPEFGIVVWTKDDDTVDSIRCGKKCNWQGNNLVGMSYKSFLKIYNVLPDAENIYNTLDEKMKTQHEYDFYGLGLMLWTWHGIIRTVVVYAGE